VTALIVDDSRMIRVLVRSILEGLGVHEVEEAPDGLIAAAMTSRRWYDLLVVDGLMPGLDGVGFVRRYRAAGGTAPVVLMAVERERGRVEEALRAGVTGYVVKPFTPDVLSQRIAEALGGVVRLPS
jgi:two-component system chemotaxis response regulator CheY